MIQLPFKSILLGYEIVHTIFEMYLKYRQIQKYRIQEIPEELQDIKISQQEFKKSQDYSFQKLAFKMTIQPILTVFNITLICCNYYAFLWDKLNFESEYQNALAFVIIEIFRNIFQHISIELYEIFVIQEQFGFNKQNIQLFIKDKTTGFILQCTIISILLYLYLLIVEWGGDYFFFYVQILVLTFIFLMSFIYPNYIAPLYNKFDDLKDGQLKNDINKLAEQLQFPLTKIYVIDGSKRSDHSNAYFFGFWKNKRIVLYDTLFKHMNDNQILAVMCHELGHWYYGHTYYNLILGMSEIFMIFYSFSHFRNDVNFYNSFGFKEQSIFIGTLLFFQIFEPISFFLQSFTLKLSRKFEFQADQFAKIHGKDREMISGLIKLTNENASGLIIDPLYASWTLTHPTLLERISALDYKHKIE